MQQFKNLFIYCKFPDSNTSGRVVVGVDLYVILASHEGTDAIEALSVPPADKSYQ
jgi:hypothetical protein